MNRSLFSRKMPMQIHFCMNGGVQVTARTCAQISALSLEITYRQSDSRESVPQGHGACQTHSHICLHQETSQNWDVTHKVTRLQPRLLFYSTVTYWYTRLHVRLITWLVCIRTLLDVRRPWTVKASCLWEQKLLACLDFTVSFWHP